MKIKILEKLDNTKNTAQISGILDNESWVNPEITNNKTVNITEQLGGIISLPIE